MAAQSHQGFLAQRSVGVTGSGSEFPGGRGAPHLEQFALLEGLRSLGARYGRGAGVGLQFTASRSAPGLDQVASALDTCLCEGAVARSTIRADVIRACLGRLE
jgi:hypothetical protein